MGIVLMAAGDGHQRGRAHRAIGPFGGGAEVARTRWKLAREGELWGLGLTCAGRFASVGLVIWDRWTALAPAVQTVRKAEWV